MYIKYKNKFFENHIYFYLFASSFFVATQYLSNAN